MKKLVKLHTFPSMEILTNILAQRLQIELSTLFARIQATPDLKPHSN
jgi:hypothetical protein